MNASIMVYINSEKEFAPTVKYFPAEQEGNSFFALHLDRVYIDVFLKHEQMITLRDTLTEALANSPLKCGVRECEEAIALQCESCDGRYCADHCVKGGDRDGGTNPDGSPYGAYAVPSICDSCAERSHS